MLSRTTKVISGSWAWLLLTPLTPSPTAPIFVFSTAVPLVVLPLPQHSGLSLQAFAVLQAWCSRIVCLQFSTFPRSFRWKPPVFLCQTSTSFASVVVLVQSPVIFLSQSLSLFSIILISSSILIKYLLGLERWLSVKSACCSHRGPGLICQPRRWMAHNCL